MKLLIVCASFAECNFLVPLLKETIALNQDLHSFKYKNISVTVLITGVGMVATTYFLQKELAKNKYDLALNIGIAGCFNKEVELGTIYHVTSDCFAETGAEDDEYFISVFELGLQDPDQFPYEKGKLVNKGHPPIKTLNKLPMASAITVNRVHGNEQSINKIRNIFNPDVESMEGAAFFYVCLMEKISCIQLRAVSNHVEKRNRKAWNLALALTNLEKTTRILLNEISEMDL